MRYQNIIATIKGMLFKDTPKHVGRWRIESCHTKMDHKIDLSNEDHCGPCGQYALNKIDTIPHKNTAVSLDKSSRV